MKLAIVGSRDFKALHRVKEFCEALPAGTELVSGGAFGVDTEVAKVALANKDRFGYKQFTPDWSKGRFAGMFRNENIVSYCDKLIAFWNGTSLGTRNSIQLAYNVGKLFFIIGYDRCYSLPDGACISLDCDLHKDFGWTNGINLRSVAHAVQSLSMARE